MRASRRATIPTANATDIGAHTLFRSVGRGSFGPGRPGRPVRPRALCVQVMATTTLAASEYAYPVAGTSDALYDLRELRPSQSFVLIASSAAGYTSVPLANTCAPGESFAGSTLPLPMMCMTGTPCANR